MTLIWFKVISGLLGIIPYLTLLVAAFVLPDFINRENHEYFRPLQKNIREISLYVVIFSNIAFFFFGLLSKVLPKGKKTLWVALLFFGNSFVIPFFWYHYIWKYEYEKKSNISP